MGLPDTSAITVLADGARWIWEEQVKHLRHADGVLDIFHALEQIAATGKVLHTDTATYQQWCEQSKEVLWRTGANGIEEFVQRNFATLSQTQQASVNGLLDDLAPHQLHLHDRERLAAGQSIGSGQIEGACKNLIDKRLKANASNWKVRRRPANACARRMAGLCSIMYTHWETYWQTT